MKFHTQKPSPLLSPYVKSYWMIENSMPLGNKHIQRIVPTGLLELSFYLGDKPSSSDPQKSISESSVITGQLKEFFDIQITGKLSLFSVYFYPHGLALFLDIPVRELNNLTVPLQQLMFPVAKELEEKLAETPSFQKRIALMELFLLDRLRKIAAKPHKKRIRNSIEIINRSGGMVDINTLASEACLSRKQFERMFQDTVGTSPKQLLKIIRFQHAIRKKAYGKELSLTEIAFECGYYDQSHMIRDFLHLSGKTPKEYFQEGEAFSDYFQE